jgi:hypothetical protein
MVVVGSSEALVTKPPHPLRSLKAVISWSPMWAHQLVRLKPVHIFITYFSVTTRNFLACVRPCQRWSHKHEDRRYVIHFNNTRTDQGAAQVCPFTIKSISTMHGQSCCTTRNVAQHDWSCMGRITLHGVLKLYVSRYNRNSLLTGRGKGVELGGGWNWF